MIIKNRRRHVSRLYETYRIHIGAGIAARTIAVRFDQLLILTLGHSESVLVNVVVCARCARGSDGLKVGGTH